MIRTANGYIDRRLSSVCSFDRHELSPWHPATADNVGGDLWF